MRGRKAKPTPIKILHATAKKAERLVKRQIETPGALIDPPEWLTVNQKADWSFAIENAPRNVLKRIDKAVLAGWVVAQDIHRRACIALQQTQLLINPALPKPNPYLSIANRQMVLMLRAASELGFTPCARARIEMQIEPAAPFGDWEDVG
jgi:P27 family predicted phage terminase small subunit